jgi:hypothetical protein
MRSGVRIWHFSLMQNTRAHLGAQRVRRPFGRDGFGIIEASK